MDEYEEDLFLHCKNKQPFPSTPLIDRTFNPSGGGATNLIKSPTRNPWNLEVMEIRKKKCIKFVDFTCMQSVQIIFFSTLKLTLQPW